jgi:hypothetical protein
MIQQQPGGLSGLRQNFHEKRLGGLVIPSGWRQDRTCQFPPTTSSTRPGPARDQVQHATRSSTRRQPLATAAGCRSRHFAGSCQFAALPAPAHVSGQQTHPNGQFPTQSALMELGMNLLKSLEMPGTGAA